MKLKINLLPPEKKEELNNLKMIGWLMKIGIIGFLAAGVFLLFAEFSLLAISIQEKSLSQEMAQFRSRSDYIVAKRAQESIVSNHQRIQLVKTELSDIKSHWDVVSLVNQKTPEGIVFNNLSIAGEELSIRGTAAKREDLLKFLQQLKETDILEEPQSPLANIVSGTNASFEITAKIKDAKK